MMTYAACTAFAGFAAWQDLRKDKIYNAYILPGMAAGVVLRTCAGGLPGLGASLACAALTLAVLMPVYLVGGLGAGDVKLLAGIAAFLAYREMALVTACAFVLTALYGLGKGLLKRHIRGTIHFAVPVFFSLVLVWGMEVYR